MMVFYKSTILLLTITTIVVCAACSEQYMAIVFYTSTMLFTIKAIVIWISYMHSLINICWSFINPLFCYLFAVKLSNLQIHIDQIDLLNELKVSC